MNIRGRKNWGLYIAFFMLVFAGTNMVSAQILVIANKHLAIDSMTRADIAKIWLGKRKSVGNSGVLTPVDLGKRDKIYLDFYKKVLNKTSKQVKIYWGKMMFSGKHFPPKRLYDEEEVMAFVKHNEGAVGYISAEAVDDSVKVLFTAE